MKARNFIFYLLIIAGVGTLITLAAESNSTPSNHTDHTQNAPYNSNAEEKSEQKSPNGRYQMFSGETWYAMGSNASHIPVMMKLDTQTGRSWMLVMMDGTNGSQLGFAELPNVQHK